MRIARSGIGPRVARARALRFAALALLAFAAALLAVAWTFADLGLGWLERRAGRARGRLGQALSDNHRLAFYASLDEPAPSDLVTGLPVLGSAAVRVPGVFGSARRFDGRPGENLVSAVPWRRAARDGIAVSFSIRLPVDAATGERRLVWDHDSNGEIGLRLRGGALEAVFTDGAGEHVLAAPAPAPGRFVPVALSVGPERAALYVDGAECAAAEVSGPVRAPSHFVSIGTDGHFPPAFDVDEWCVWAKPLDAGAAAFLASSRRPVPERLERGLARSARRRAKQAAAFRSLCRVLGVFRAPRSAPAVLNRSIPAFELRLSRGDRRHFRDAHLEAAASGFRTRRGVRPRHVQAMFGGRSERLLAWLDETVPDAPLSSRPAFVLASEGGLFGEGSGLVRLFPPEQFGARHPDAARPLPLDAGSLVRLHLDGDFLGLYCLVPFESPASAWFATGTRDVLRPDRLHYATPIADPAAGAGLSEEERERAWRRMLSLLCADPGFPLREPEARLLARRHALRRETLQFADPAPGPEPLLGDNPAALYVTNDLDLAAAGPVSSWRSSDPATVSAGGRVVRPADGRPRFVVLTAAYPDGSEREFRFRVMPHAPALPALFLSFGRPLDKLARTDFVCLRIPAGENPEPSWMSGTGPGGGGAKLRGNTSFVTGRRRPMNLEFDEAVLFPGVSEPVDHILLLSGYADPTRLRNALSYDVFRAMSPAGTVRAAPVFWTEVFVNGAYAGVWECCPRLQDVLSESFSALYKVRSSYGLWTDPKGTSESVDRVGDVEEEDPYEPIRDLAGFVAGSGRDALAACGPETFDMDELLDFWLLINFTGNEDGRVTNQFVGRRAEDGRWILMPWDYDKTFLPGRVAAARGRTAPLSSPLFDRLLASDPTLRLRLSARWRALRAGPLSDAALAAWIDERAALLSPFMDEDYRVVPPLGHDGDFADAVRILRQEVRDRAAWLDGYLSGERGPGRQAVAESAPERASAAVSGGASDVGTDRSQNAR